MNCSHQAPLSIGFSRQEYWSGLRFPSPQYILCKKYFDVKYVILYLIIFITSVTQLCLTLQPHGLQQTRLPCPSPTPKACSNSCPLSQWCHPTLSLSVISSSVIPFSCLQSFHHQGLFQWVSSSYQVAKVLELQLHHQSSQRILRTDFH